MSVGVGERAPDFELPGRHDPDGGGYQMHGVSGEAPSDDVVAEALASVQG